MTDETDGAWEPEESSGWVPESERLEQLEEKAEQLQETTQQLIQHSVTNAEIDQMASLTFQNAANAIVLLQRQIDQIKAELQLVTGRPLPEDQRTIEQTAAGLPYPETFLAALRHQLKPRSEEGGQ